MTASRATQTEAAAEVTRRFAETSSIHGIGYMARGTALQATLWGVVCAASLGERRSVISMETNDTSRDDPRLTQEL